MRAKPTKWGWKLWQLACATSSFTLHISAYVGAAAAIDAKKEEALGTEVVCTLLEPYKEKGRAVAVDNFFSSVDLAQKLWMMGIGMVRTVKANRRGMPVQFRGAELKAAKKEIKLGEYKVVQCGDLRVTLWKDRAAVLFISSAVCDPRGDTFVLRWIKGPERERVPCPPVADLYNTYMRGVDRSDQLQSYYPPGRKQLRWQAALAWELIDKCIVNAWILRKGDPLLEEMTHLDFRLQLVIDLIDNYSSRERPGPNLHHVSATTSSSSDLNSSAPSAVLRRSACAATMPAETAACMFARPVTTSTCALMFDIILLLIELLSVHVLVWRVSGVHCSPLLW